MNTKIACDGEIDKTLRKHRKEFFPHMTSWHSYFIEIAKQRAEEDFKKKDKGES